MRLIATKESFFWVSCACATSPYDPFPSNRINLYRSPTAHFEKSVVGGVFDGAAEFVAVVAAAEAVDDVADVADVLDAAVAAVLEPVVAAAVYDDELLYGIVFGVSVIFEELFGRGVGIESPKGVGGGIIAAGVGGGAGGTSTKDGVLFTKKCSSSSSSSSKSVA